MYTQALSHADWLVATKIVVIDAKKVVIFVPIHFFSVFPHSCPVSFPNHPRVPSRPITIFRCFVNYWHLKESVERSLKDDYGVQ